MGNESRAGQGQSTVVAPTPSPMCAPLGGACRLLRQHIIATNLRNRTDLHRIAHWMDPGVRSGVVRCNGLRMGSCAVAHLGVPSSLLQDGASAWPAGIGSDVRHLSIEVFNDRGTVVCTLWPLGLRPKRHTAGSDTSTTFPRFAEWIGHVGPFLHSLTLTIPGMKLSPSSFRSLWHHTLGTLIHLHRCTLEIPGHGPYDAAHPARRADDSPCAVVMDVPTPKMGQYYIQSTFLESLNLNLQGNPFKTEELHAVVAGLRNAKLGRLYTFQLDLRNTLADNALGNPLGLLLCQQLGHCRSMSLEIDSYGDRSTGVQRSPPALFFDTNGFLPFVEQMNGCAGPLRWRHATLTFGSASFMSCCVAAWSAWLLQPANLPDLETLNLNVVVGAAVPGHLKNLALHIPSRNTIFPLQSTVNRIADGSDLPPGAVPSDRGTTPAHRACPFAPIWSRT